MAQQQKKSARNKALRGSVTPSREPAVIGAVCGAVCLMILILCILDHAKRSTCICFGVLAALNIPLLMTRNIRIDYHEKKGFVYRNLFGAGQRFYWHEITAVREVQSRKIGRNSRKNPPDTLVITEKRRIRVRWDAHNRTGFILLAKHYAEERREKNAADRHKGLSEG